MKRERAIQSRAASLRTDAAIDTVSEAPIKLPGNS